MGNDSTLERHGPKGTPIGRVRGLGAARHGAGEWLIVRYTSAGSLLLCAFALFSFLLLPGFAYDTVRDWAAGPIPATALALLIVTVFWHTRSGVVELILDYVHDEGNKFAAMLALNLAVVGGAVFGLFCIARLALGGAA
ncbi:MAG: succinate dehydrogenase, hydrophobic membrane anchor protein [Croceibacterium sp.]|jgi:succinate dehydrogenase / fumarate reductase membrane anchor subunit